ncbi:MAG: OmpA family protein [Prevotellaceae bacterium]|nr:OmpA family protein [Prevotellaceae bacterium]
MVILQLALLSSSVYLVAQPLDSEPVGASFKKAVGFHQRGQYKEALNFYRESLKENGNNKGGLAVLIAKQMASCEYAIKRVSDPEPVTVTKLGADINGPTYSNINAYPSNTEQTFYFTSSRSEKAVKSGTTQMDRLCIAQRSDRTGGQWDVKIVTGNKRYHESVLGISPDGKDIFVFRGSRDIFLLDVSSSFDMQAAIGGKVDYIPMAKRYDMDLSKDHPISSLAITRDKKTIYMSMNDYGDKGGYGGFDIWRSDYDVVKRTWGPLTNLGPAINTENDEIAVSVHPDGATIYFSSNGHKGMGKFDIYRSEYADSLASWGKPVHLGFPINTANDDIYYNAVPGNPKHAYYSSEREDEPGVYDIRFVNYYGRILSEEEKERLRQEYLKAVEEAKKDIKPIKSSDTKLLAKKGYDNFPTDSIKVGMKVYLQSILFANAKATLLPKSYKQLEQLYRLMLYHPLLKVEISGHTDNTGKKATNQRLSGERAQSVVDYLIGRGIEPNRLSARGYSDTQPIAPNKTAAGKALNRRVEFKVTALGMENEGAN